MWEEIIRLESSQSGGCRDTVTTEDCYQSKDQLAGTATEGPSNLYFFVINLTGLLDRNVYSKA